MGEQWEEHDIPADLASEAEDARHQLIDVLSNFDDGIMEKYLADEEITADDLRRALRTATLASRGRPGPVRLGLQEQGRPADARRGGRLPAQPARPARRPPGTKPGKEEPDRAHGRRRRALLGPGLQDHDRPLRGQADLPAGLLGHPAQGRHGHQHHQGPQGADRPAAADARQPPRGQGRHLRRRHRGRRRAQADDHRRHPVRPGPPDRARGARRSPSRSSTWRSSPRPRPTRTSCPRPSSPCPRRTRPSGCAPTRRPARRSSRAWASSTSRCWSTGCCGSSASTPTWASPRWPTARPSASRSRRSRSATSARPVAGASTATWSSPSSPPAPAAATSSSTRSPAASSPRSTSPRSTPASRRPLTSGVLAGYPTVDVRVTLTYGSYHDVDSSEMAFKIAGSMAVKKAAREASPVLLEPVMAVEVVTPEDYMGDVIGDLSSRRGRVEGMEQRGSSHVVRAQVPLADMFGYATDLRSRTQGRATYTMQFHAYKEVPESISKEIIARAHGRVERQHRRSGDIAHATNNAAGIPPRRARGGPARDQGVVADNGQAEVRAHQASRQRRHDGSHRPRQDHADGRHHQGALGEQPQHVLHALRPDRQGARGEAARHHDHDRPRRVRDAQPALRPRRHAGPRRLHQEHDHRRRPGGRGHPGGLGRRRPDAPDP